MGRFAVHAVQQDYGIIILDICRQAIPLLSRSVNLIAYEEGNFFQ